MVRDQLGAGDIPIEGKGIRPRAVRGRRGKPEARAGGVRIWRGIQIAVRRRAILVGEPLPLLWAPV